MALSAEDERFVKRLQAVVPRPKETDDEAQSNQNEVKRHAWMKLMTFLVTHPDSVSDILLCAEKYLFDTKTRGDDEWMKTPTYVGQLEEGWCAQLIVHNDAMLSKANPITRELLGYLESRDARIIINLVMMFTGTAMYTPLSTECQQSNRVTFLTLSKRLQDLGWMAG